MDEKKILLNAAACLKYLSQAKDPVTKKDVPENDTVRNPVVAKYLGFAADKLRELFYSMENEESIPVETFVPENAVSTTGQPVSVPEQKPEQSAPADNNPVRERIVCDESGEALRIGEIRERFNRDAKPKTVGYIGSDVLLGWLEYNGFLEKDTGGKHYIITESGMEAGIFPQENPKGGLTLYYTPAVQQMIYDNEDDIREYYEEYGDKRELFFIAPDKKGLLVAGEDTTKITDISSYLNTFADMENYKPIQPAVINKWLAEKGMIFRNESQKRYFATIEGEINGFENIRIDSDKYGRLNYTSDAWQYIIDNIDELIEYNRGFGG